jgi:hypothetical protein
MLGWFINQASIGSASQADLWFLAHAAPGIIWGKLVQGKLHLSSDYFPAVSPPLEAQTLWEARLFCQSTQLHLWRTTAGFAAWRIDERPKVAADPAQNFAFDEWHRLWEQPSKLHRRHHRHRSHKRRALRCWLMVRKGYGWRCPFSWRKINSRRRKLIQDTGPPVSSPAAMSLLMMTVAPV